MIVGPTATGKSDLAAHLARRLDGEIVGVDSVQVYRGLDAGTGKPPLSVRREIPHHLIDIADPGRDFSAGDYARLAERAIAEIVARGRRPILAGGTGLYLRALLRGLADMPPRQPRLRSALQRWGERRGEGSLHRMLRELDPITAARLSPRDGQRVVRAIEVALATGRPLSEEIATSPFGPDRFGAVKVGLKMPWGALTARIEARVDAFFERGIVEEVRGLLAAGVPPGANCFKALGYREVLRHLEGRTSLEETVALVKGNTRRYAKRQMTWFRREPGLIWYDVGERAEEIFADIEREIASRTGAGGSGDGNRQPE